MQHTQGPTWGSINTSIVLGGLLGILGYTAYRVGPDLAKKLSNYDTGGYGGGAEDHGFIKDDNVINYDRSAAAEAIIGGTRRRPARKM